MLYTTSRSNTNRPAHSTDSDTMKDLTKYTLESPLNLTPASVLDNFQRRVKTYVGDNLSFIEEGAKDGSPDAFAEAAVEHFQVSAKGHGEPQLDEQQAKEFRRTAKRWYKKNVVADQKWYGAEYVNSPSHRPKNFDDVQGGQAIQYVRVFDNEDEAHAWFERFDTNIMIVPAYKIPAKMRGFYAMKAKQRNPHPATI